MRSRALSGAHGGAVTVIDHEPGVLGALGDRGQQHVRHLLQQHRLAAAQDPGHRMLPGRVERIARSQDLELPGDLLVRRGDGDIFDRAGLVAQIDHTQVGQLRHGEPSDLAHRRGRVERARQHRAGLDQQMHGRVTRRLRRSAGGHGVFPLELWHGQLV